MKNIQCQGKKFQDEAVKQQILCKNYVKLITSVALKAGWRSVLAAAVPTVLLYLGPLSCQGLKPMVIISVVPMALA